MRFFFFVVVSCTRPSKLLLFSLDFVSMRSLGLSCVLLVAILCSGALSWEATYTSLPSNDAFGSNGLPIAGKRLRAGFYVTPASGNRLLCASRDDDLWV